MEFLLLLALVIANGLFAMSEMAIVSARRARLQNRADKGDARARAALQLSADPNRFLSAVQIGITLIGIMAGDLGGSTLAQGLADFIRTSIPALAYSADAIGVALIVALTTYLSLVIGELVPKRLALRYPEAIASFVARPMGLLARLATPLVWALSISTGAILRLLGVRNNQESPVSEGEILSMIRLGIHQGVFGKDLAKMKKIWSKV